MRLASKFYRFTKALITRKLEFEFERMPFCLDNVSNNKLKNLILNEMNCARHEPKAPLYPVQLHIEPSSSCTLNCPVCPAATETANHQHRIMRMEMFKHLLDETGEHATVAILWMWGEPFINKILPEMITYAHEKNVATLTSTNGQHIQTREEAEELVASGLDGLIVALDGATQETYSRYRIGGDIQKVFRCLDLVQQAKISLGSKKPLVNVRTVVNKANESELFDIEKIARKHGANMTTRKSMAICDLSSLESAKALLPTNPLYIRSRISNGNIVNRPADDFRCRRPWNRMTVNSDGIVTGCEFDFNHAAPFGQSGNGNSFLDIWLGKSASSFRREFLAKKSQFPFCSKCTYKDGGSFHSTVETILLETKEK
ncbi:MAG: radical SAM/SPASM domain-containing protein [Armatimonadota bacterium]